MFKSVFSKYIALTTLLITFAILLLVLTVSTMLSVYYADANTKTLSKTADSVKEATEVCIIDGGSFDDIPEIYVTYLEGTAKIVKSSIFITDSNGIVLISTDTEYPVGTELLSDSVMENTKSGNGSRYNISRLDGAFGEIRFNTLRSIDGGKYFALVSASSSGDDTMSSAMIRMIIITAMWILLASSLTMYILLRRIIDPLRSVSEAAKAFAKGDFTKRVEVTGEDEVADLASAFNNMASVLEKNEEMRNSFLGSVSHDLRTPMTTIGGFVDAIRDGTVPPEQRDHYLEIISSEVKRLSRLVNSLLEISRMQSGEKKLKFTRFNVSEKARQILLSMETRIDEKHIDVEFECENDVTVSADTDAVHQILYNLMDNAVKFTEEGGKLSVSIKQYNKKCHIIIRNTGDGIPEDELPHVFDRFYKSDRSRGLDKTGTGLGLFIVKTNVNLHGENITVKSKQGEYTEFEFTLAL